MSRSLGMLTIGPSPFASARIDFCKGKRAGSMLNRRARPVFVLFTARARRSGLRRSTRILGPNANRFDFRRDGIGAHLFRGTPLTFAA